MPEFCNQINLNPFQISTSSQPHGSRPSWTRFMRWSTQSSGPLMTQIHCWYWLTTLTSVRKTKVFWGAIKIKLQKGLMKLMELNLILYEISDTSAIYLKACDSIHQLLSMLFGLHTIHVGFYTGHWIWLFQFLNTNASSSVTHFYTEVKNNHTQTFWYLLLAGSRIYFHLSKSPIFSKGSSYF